jgi:hypothetical protein
VDFFGIRRCKFEEFGIAQAVVNNDLRAPEAGFPFEREEQRVAGTGADEVTDSFRHSGTLANPGTAKKSF